MVSVTSREATVLTGELTSECRSIAVTAARIAFDKTMMSVLLSLYQAGKPVATRRLLHLARNNWSMSHKRLQLLESMGLVERREARDQYNRPIIQNKLTDRGRLIAELLLQAIPIEDQYSLEHIRVSME